MASVRVKAHTRNGKRVKAHTRVTGGGGGRSQVDQVASEEWRRMKVGAALGLGVGATAAALKFAPIAGPVASHFAGPLIRRQIAQAALRSPAGSLRSRAGTRLVRSQRIFVTAQREALRKTNISRIRKGLPPRSIPRSRGKPGRPRRRR